MELFGTSLFKWQPNQLGGVPCGTLSSINRVKGFFSFFFVNEWMNEWFIRHCMFYNCTQITANTRYLSNSKLKKRHASGWTDGKWFFLFVFFIFIWPFHHCTPRSTAHVNSKEFITEPLWSLIWHCQDSKIFISV